MNHPTTTEEPHGLLVAAKANASLLMCMLDEVDYAMLLVTADGALRYANQLALAEVLCEGPLALARGRIHAHHAADHEALHEALGDAVRGRRRLLTLGRDGHAASVAVVPLPCGEAATSEPLALLKFGKRRHCEALTIDFYARTHGLTGAEARVLHGLCEGARPKEIARAAGVAISTVRSHVGSIRQKTQTGSIGALVHLVTALPPITSAIKWAARPGGAASPARPRATSPLWTERVVDEAQPVAA